jgi:hypothetical protein
MSFNVGGIKFTKDELSTIALTEIRAGSISHSHFFHLLPGGRRAILLLRAGDYIEQSFITKYLEKGMMSLYQLEVVSQEDIDEYKTFWQDIRSSKSEKELFRGRDKVLNKIVSDFWSGEEKSFLSYVIACFDEFYFYPDHVMDKYQSISMVLYSRALLASSLSTLTALTNSYLDYNFIKDFYNTCFIMDFSLVEYGTFHYTISMACEAERKLPGSGLELLVKMNRSEGERQLYLNHPELSHEFGLTQVEKFSNPEVLDLLLTHHEKYDGSGFPKGYRYTAISDAETLLSFCDYMIPFAEHFFEKGDGNKILNHGYFSLSKLERKDLLPIKKIMHRWLVMMNHSLADIGSDSQVSEAAGP